MNNWVRVIGIVGLGLILGVGLGLYLGWAVWPVEFVDADPAGLQANVQDDYLLMIAVVYAQDGDLNNARAHLAGLGEEAGQLLLTYTVEAILSGRDETEIRPLVALAHDLGFDSPAMAPYLPADVQK